jgi:hypothetical protein
MNREAKWLSEQGQILSGPRIRTPANPSTPSPSPEVKHDLKKEVWCPPSTVGSERKRGRVLLFLLSCSLCLPRPLSPSVRALPLTCSFQILFLIPTESRLCLSNRQEQRACLFWGGGGGGGRPVGGPPERRRHFQPHYNARAPPVSPAASPANF